MRPSRCLVLAAALAGLFSLHCGSSAKSSPAGGDGGLDTEGSSSGSGTSSGGASSGGASSGGASSGGASSGGASSGAGGTSSSSGGGDCDGAAPAAGGGVTFSVDMSKGPARQFQPPAKPAAISPYVYGINAFGIWEQTTKWGLARQGGDATTVWNWTNNYSNSGADYCYWEGQDSGGSTLAGSITSPQSSFPISTAQSLGVAYLATAPIVDYVSATFSNNTGINNLCPGSPSCSGANGYASNTGNLTFATPTASGPAFVANSASKPGGSYCTCQPGGACASGCAVNASGTVYQDEFANYLKVQYGSGAAPVFLMLDNEPNYWPGTHPEIWPHTGTPGCGTSGTVSFDDIVTRNTTYATAIKKAWPQTKIFGPVVAQDGIIYAGDYNDPNLPTPFTDYYLGKMASNSVSAGVPLIDAFDVHYYTSNGTTSQCVQVPRMFWDPSFMDFSASATDSIDYGWSGQNNYFDTSLYPRQMIPRLLGKIANAYGTKNTAAPGLSFSEYNAGCETVIQGGVAEADLLGVFGREGVYAATAWPLKTITSNNQLVNYLVAAYDLYRNYDGKGSVVGDTTVLATTSSVEQTSVYAFAHSGGATRVDLVAVNKTSAALPVSIVIADAPALTGASLYQLVDGKAGVVAVAGAPPTVTCACGTCSLAYTLPAMSATTVVLQ